MPTSSKFSLKPALKAIKKKQADYLSRRPHRSFRMTRRRDYKRDLQLPGYFAFTFEVSKLLWAQRKLFLALGLFYAVFTAVLVGIGSQDSYTALANSLSEAGSDIAEGDLAQVNQAVFVFAAILAGGLNDGLSEVQQIYAVLLGLLVWLTTVWLLRNKLAGHTARLRDGLYNAGAPLLPTLLVSLVLVLQLLPVSIAALAYVAAMASGLLSAGGIAAMLFWLFAGGAALLSLYFMTSTFFALIVVSLPGTYPMHALRVAGDLVMGRRLRLLLRLLWMLVSIVGAWAVIMVPLIIFDIWLKSVWTQIDWIPSIPLLIVLLSSLSIIWAASYVYLLYRKVIDNDTE